MQEELYTFFGVIHPARPPRPIPMLILVDPSAGASHSPGVLEGSAAASGATKRAWFEKRLSGGHGYGWRRWGR